MEQAFLVFVNGVVGVFAGMALVYASVRLISQVVGRLVADKEGTR